MAEQPEGARDEPRTSARVLRVGWTSAWIFALLTAAAFCYAAWRNAMNPPGVDFAGFWAAGRLAVLGKPALAYDAGVHASIALEGGVRGLLPFPYPPSFLLVLAPFGLARFPIAFVLWVLATTASYLVLTRRTVPLPFGLALPPAMSNVLVGQNGFLLTGIFVGAADLLDARPWLAGFLFGLLAVKPQVGILIPIALIAGKHRKAFVGAGLSVIGVAAVALLCFGPGTFQACLRSMGYLTELMRGTASPWHKLASVFAFARSCGVPEVPSLVLQAIAASAAASTTWLVWRRRDPAAVPVLAAATMLVPPYLFTYDALLLIVPFGWLIRHGRPVAASVVWVCCLPPVLGYLDLYHGPNTTPVAAVFALFALLR